MPDKTRVEQFIEAVVYGDHVQAIAEFYHQDASMQENAEPPRTGRAALMAHEEKSLRRIKGMETLPDPTFLIDGDHVAINWTFILTDLEGTRRKLEELSLQQWRGDRISVERFFYDTASAWQPLEDGGKLK